MSAEEEAHNPYDAIQNATTLAERLRAVLDYYTPREEGGWWPFDQDHPEYKRGAIQAETFWRGQIEAALMLDAKQAALAEPASEDEREALWHVLLTEFAYCEEDPGVAELRDAILAAGFRRPGPITDAQVEAAAWAILDRNMDIADRAPSKDTYEDALADARAALEAARDAS